MQMRTLGKQGLETSAIGLGCMGMSNVYGPADEKESIATIQHALDLGVSLLDTADVYGFKTNEQLIQRAIEGRREQAVLATKFGMRRDSDGKLIGIDGSPAYVREACEGSLERLGVDCIDLYYLHRVDPKVPVEETVGAMAGLVEDGKVRYIGLCETGAETIRQAHAVHPLSVIQSEYSIMTRDPESEVLPTLRELGIGFVAYSPFGRGMLTGRFKSEDDLVGRDYRRTFPRFQGENLAHNAALVDDIELIAGEKGVTSAQLSLAWLLSRGDDIVPIPGTKQARYVEQNVAALDVELTEDDLGLIDAAMPAGSVMGPRFRAAAMKRVSR